MIYELVGGPHDGEVVEFEEDAEVMEDISVGDSLPIEVNDTIDGIPIRSVIAVSRVAVYEPIRYEDGRWLCCYDRTEFHAG